MTTPARMLLSVYLAFYITYLICLLVGWARERWFQ